MDSRSSTALEMRAEQVSKRGGSHATMLGGMICRNKDKKKGQQDTYAWFMEVRLGHHVPYPDVSNTHYGSHGEAAGTIIAYLDSFIAFMDSVRHQKENPSLTNIEQNFENALKDAPTLTELCVLALYNTLVSKPFMSIVRSHANMLDLKSLFEEKVAYLEGVTSEPSRWTSPDVVPLQVGPASHTASDDIPGWDDFSIRVIEAVQDRAKNLPDLHMAVSSFTHGALTTFVERFSEEFKSGGDIDRLTPEESKTLFFSSTNDMNEGSLGSWRIAQQQKPTETLHKFNAGFIWNRNATEDFINKKLPTQEDDAYLRQTARKIDSSGLQKQLKLDQMAADAAKAVDGQKKLERQLQKKEQSALRMEETRKNLVTETEKINVLKNQDLMLVPLKKDLKTKAVMVRELIKAVSRYQKRQLAGLGVGVKAVLREDSEIEDDRFDYESDHNGDLI
ncbi:hypothetical protein NP233_g11353 [Leucocoprinus birnbaumii]|uniref:Uncharacterized protein n=1 Tax=Leucocoprinus birnbaumii TaxID=56174 RepID=A0AAD5YKH8_9AGAR|nr:hypothetical protein NP233_g11353 [Leucocoprinus birnbaumii]